MPRPSVIAPAALALMGVGLVAAVVVLALARDDGRIPPPAPSEPAAYTVALVDEALAYYEREGREAALARYRSPSAVDGDWYVFIADAASGDLLAHYDPAIMGQPLDGPLGVDVTGYRFGRALLAADEEGRWVSYVFASPRSGEQQRKHAWAVRRDGLLFVSGWYEHAPFATSTPEPEPTPDPPPAAGSAPVVVHVSPGEGSPAAFTQSFVAAALELAEMQGFSHALDYYGSRESIDGDWYVFIAQESDGTVLAHAASPGHVGQSLRGPLGVDSTGDRFGPRLLAASVEGVWVHYVHRNPRTCHTGVKHAWAVNRDGIVYVSGWYEDDAPVHPLLPSKCEPEAYARATLRRAIERYDDAGREAAIAFHGDPSNNDGRWYVFLVDPAAGTVLAHPAAAFVGYDFVAGDEGYDDSGFHYAPLMLGATDAGLVVRGIISSPTQDELNPFHAAEEVKHYYAVPHDGVLFATGWYEPAPDPVADPAGYARLLVARALTRYDDRGLDNTLIHYNSPESVEDGRYVFVLEDQDPGGLYTVANAARPGRVGTAEGWVDASGYDYGGAFREATQAGRWVSHLAENGAARRTWIVRRGDLLFGAGYEPE